MDNDESEILRKRRFILQNPSAHIEQLVEIEARTFANANAVSASRTLLQNPYAHLDGDGRYSALSADIESGEKRRGIKNIEQLAIFVQRRLWKERFELWRDDAPTSPIDILDPEKAAHLLGFQVKQEESLGVYRGQFGRVAVAGILDRDTNQIRISKEFPITTQRFTAAHEIGHLMLHREMSVIHRDRALDGKKLSRDRVEFEADKFAVFFLLPEKVVRKEFENRFLTQNFQLNEGTAFAFGMKKLLNEIGEGRPLSRVLATAIKFNGRFFRSLSETFKVTPETMAIRLEELGLIQKA